MRDAVIYLYDIKIATKGKLPAAIGRGAFRQFEVLMRSVYPGSHFVYDGQALAYSSTEVKEPCSFTILADQNMEIDIPLLEQGNYSLRIYRACIIAYVQMQDSVSTCISLILTNHTLTEQ